MFFTEILDSQLQGVGSSKLLQSEMAIGGLGRKTRLKILGENLGPMKTRSLFGVLLYHTLSGFFSVGFEGYWEKSTSSVSLSHFFLWTGRKKNVKKTSPEPKPKNRTKKPPKTQRRRFESDLPTQATHKKCPYSVFTFWLLTQHSWSKFLTCKCVINWVATGTPAFTLRHLHNSLTISNYFPLQGLPATSMLCCCSGSILASKKTTTNPRLSHLYWHSPKEAWFFLGTYCPLCTYSQLPLISLMRPTFPNWKEKIQLEGNKDFPGRQEGS